MPEVQTSAGPVSYALKRSHRRTLALRVSPDGSVTVNAPRFALGLFIDRFVRQQAEWIAAQLRRFAEISRRHPRKQFISGELFWVDGAEVSLCVAGNDRSAEAVCELVDGQLKVTLNLSSESSDEAVKTALKQWYWKQTETRVAQAVKRYAPLLHVSPRNIRVANQNSRWGSCSSRGDLRFNWRLSMAPPAVLEGVVVHELAHLRVHDHSPRFWSTVASAVPDYKERRAWLRIYGHSLSF